MTTPTDAEIIARALALLESGLLPSAVPERLMSEFGITADRARRLAAAAIERRQRDRTRAGNGAR